MTLESAAATTSDSISTQAVLLAGRGVPSSPSSSSTSPCEPASPEPPYWDSSDPAAVSCSTLRDLKYQRYCCYLAHIFTAINCDLKLPNKETSGKIEENQQITMIEMGSPTQPGNLVSQGYAKYLDGTHRRLAPPQLTMFWMTHIRTLLQRFAYACVRSLCRFCQAL